MTTVEFSSEFDILYNNIMSNMKAPGLDEYEKSVFLTKAQLEIILNHFNPKGNKYQEGVDDSTKRQIELSELIKIDSPSLIPDGDSFDKRGLLFALPTDTLLVLNEAFSWTKGSSLVEYQVLPISFTEYFRLMLKPYKAPLKNQVWRLLKDGGTEDAEVPTNIIVEIIPHISKTEGTEPSYKIRYVKRPVPIILEDLTDLNITIEGITDITECELNPIIHNEILNRAVVLAKNAYLGDLKSTIELNTRNE